MNPDERSKAAELVETANASLLEIIDHVLNKGVVVSGEVMLGVAGVDLVYLRVSAVLCAADRVQPLQVGARADSATGLSRLPGLAGPPTADRAPAPGGAGRAPPPRVSPRAPPPRVSSQAPRPRVSSQAPRPRVSSQAPRARVSSQAPRPRLSASARPASRGKPATPGKPRAPPGRR